MIDPHLRARGVFADFEHPQSGRFPAIQLPFQFSGYDNPTANRPPLLGEHTDLVLHDLGYNAQDIDALHRAGAV
ncbi:Formyl-coenzyme A transferase [compost metagenome]